VIAMDIIGVSLFSILRCTLVNKPVKVTGMDNDGYEHR
jgi:hypothetical protein